MIMDFGNAYVFFCAFLLLNHIMIQEPKEADAIRVCAEDILQADETYVRGWILESLNEWVW